MTAGALVVGEALIDEVVDGERVRRHPGGSPANVALGLSRLSVHTRLHTALGADSDGLSVSRHLADSGVRVTATSSTAQPTSRATATIGVDGAATYEFALRWAPNHLDEIGRPRVIHTGSLGAFLEPGHAIASDIVRRGRRAGALITFDPNVRAAIMGAPSRARALFSAFASSSHLVKLSDEDAEYLYPGRSLDAVLDILLGTGVSVAVITQGDRGTYLASGSSRTEVPAVRTTVTDTVGAGDSFMAAVVWALAFRGPGWSGTEVSAARLEEVGTLAARAAAITVSRAGADLPNLADLELRGVVA